MTLLSKLALTVMLSGLIVVLVAATFGLFGLEPYASYTLLAGCTAIAIGFALAIGSIIEDVWR